MNTLHTRSGYWFRQFTQEVLGENYFCSAKLLRAVRLGGKCIVEIELRVGESGLDAQGRITVGDGFVCATQVHKREAEVTFIVRVAGCERQGAFDMPPRCVKIAARRHKHTHVSLWKWHIGVELERLCKTRLRLIQLSPAQQLMPEVGLSLGVIGTGRQRRSVQVDRLAVVSFSGDHYSQIILDYGIVAGDAEGVLEQCAAGFPIRRLPV
jgi:hypothetical protein